MSLNVHARSMKTAEYCADLNILRCQKSDTVCINFGRIKTN